MNRKRVMIIDDDAQMLSLMGGQLETLYDVGRYASGFDALDALEGGQGSPGFDFA